MVTDLNIFEKTFSKICSKNGLSEESLKLIEPEFLDEIQAQFCFGAELVNPEKFKKNFNKKFSLDLKNAESIITKI